MSNALCNEPRIVLEAAAGNRRNEFASKLQTRAATVSKWRTRFAVDRRQLFLPVCVNYSCRLASC